MARIRTIKPEFWTSEHTTSLSRDARLLFIGMWNFCDDAGIHIHSVRTLKAEIFPLDDDIAVNTVQTLLDELLSSGLVMTYEAQGKAYLMVTGWHHQKINRPAYKHPLPEGVKPDKADDSFFFDD
jgi:hypothetical protein